MGWPKGSGPGAQNVEKMAAAVRSVAEARSTPTKGSAFSTKPGKGPGRYSGGKK